MTTRNKIILGTVVILLCAASIAATRWYCNSPRIIPTSELTNGDILGMLQTKAQIATTEVKIRKMGIYDSDDDKISINPKTWKIGHRMCIIPVDITLKYGIDLSDMDENDITRKDSATVAIKLPEPKIIDKSYEPRTEKGETLNQSTWFRDEIGEETQQKIKAKVFDSIIADQDGILRKTRTQIISNTRLALKSLLKGAGLKAVFVN